jgi:hypothetical protein
VQPLGPHSAPLGMRMYKRTVSPAGENATGEPWPADYDRAAVIALHGSWNRWEWVSCWAGWQRARPSKGTVSLSLPWVLQDLCHPPAAHRCARSNHDLSLSDLLTQ